MVKIVVAGVAGRMGQTIINTLIEFPQIALVGAVERPDHPNLNQESVPGIPVSSDVDKTLQAGDVLIDFTTPSGTLQNLKSCLKLRKGIVIGTTGFKQEELAEIKTAGEKIPILLSPNMSLGVNLLFHLAEETAKNLPDYEVEIVETHHNQKADAPSGTALRLAEIITTTRKQNLDEAAVYGRHGRPGPRKSSEIGIHAIRTGDVVGEHTIIFGTTGERLELTHKAGSRQAFARGALKAALFVSQQKAGFYTMSALLNLTSCKPKGLPYIGIGRT